MTFSANHLAGTSKTKYNYNQVTTQKNLNNNQLHVRLTFDLLTPKDNHFMTFPLRPLVPTDIKNRFTF